MKNLAIRDCPAYKVTSSPSTCTLVELLAAVIGGTNQLDVANALVNKFGGNARDIYNTCAEDIASVKGIGTQTAIRIKAALALGVRMCEPVENKPVINSPSDAAVLVMTEMSLLEQETLKVILLDTRNRVLSIVEIYHGTVNSSYVRVGEIFRPAIQKMAPAIIVVHNHPSGDPTPSPDDVVVTRAMVAAGKLLDITILDHIVIGQSRWVSLKERGLGFN